MIPTGTSLTQSDQERIVLPILRKEAFMSVMCSLAVCKSQQGMCGHEKVMLSVALLTVLGLSAYLLVG